MRILICLVFFSCSFGLKAQGLILDQEWYDQLLKDTKKLRGNVDASDLPGIVSLKPFSTKTQHQGGNSLTCVPHSIAHAYSVRYNYLSTIGYDLPKVLGFSASFLANQIPSICESGTVFKTVFDLLKNKGICPLEKFENTPTCIPKPEEDAVFPFGLDAIYPVWDKGVGKKAALHEIKCNLRDNLPVIIALRYTKGFRECRDEFWMPAEEDLLSGRNKITPLHAMVVVGYEDTVTGGYFECQNSYGKTWGNGGFVKIHYDDFWAYVEQGIIFYLDQKD